MSVVKQGIEIDQASLNRMNAALRKMSKGAQAEARTRAKAIAAEEADRIRSAADSRQARMVARSVRARNDRVPAIYAGGGRSVRRGVAAGDVFFGSEFGGQRRPTTRQFRPYRADGYWFNPTLKRDANRMQRQWAKVLDRVGDEWGS